LCSVFPVDPFDGFVNTANTLAISDFNTDEAFITPSFAPGVLNLPVIGKTLTVFTTDTALDFNVTGLVVPPLVDLEFIIARLRLRFRIGTRAGIYIFFICVADECDCMIER